MHLLKPVTKQTFETPRYSDKFTWTHQMAVENRKTKYQRYLGYTFDLIGDRKKYNYANHIPTIFNSNKLLELEKSFDIFYHDDEAKKAVILDVLYQNLFCENPEFIGNFRAGFWTPRPQPDCSAQLNKATILNYDDFSIKANRWLRDFVMKKFPHKSRYER
jgi:hypothetical protein